MQYEYKYNNYSMQFCVANLCIRAGYNLTEIPLGNFASACTYSYTPLIACPYIQCLHAGERVPYLVGIGAVPASLHGDQQTNVQMIISLCIAYHWWNSNLA